MSFRGWKRSESVSMLTERRERIWRRRSIYLQNFINITTASVFPLEIISVEIITQILFLLQMVILHCKHSNTILIYAFFPFHAIQYLTFFQLYTPWPWSNFSRTQQLHTQSTSTLLTESNIFYILQGLSSLSSRWRGCRIMVTQELWYTGPLTLFSPILTPPTFFLLSCHLSPIK